MTKDEALKIALEELASIKNDPFKFDLKYDISKAITAIKEALAQPEHGWTPERIAGMTRLKEAQDKKLAQPEPVKIAHKHEWFRTGEMKVGQMRCISCGTWGQEEMPKRTWVGLTDEEAFQICVDCGCLSADWLTLLDAIEAKLKEKNT